MLAAVRAYDMLGRAGAEGHPDAMVALGLLEIEGIIGSVGSGICWLRKAAERRHVGAMLELGQALSGGKGGRGGVREGVEWLKKAAELGSEAALERDQWIVRKGCSVWAKEEEARVWNRRVAEQRP
jgi:TPR repeat protein